jgi:CheY-like chemotaxis protein
MEALGQLTGGVAHDFNNLLTVIMGSLEALERRLHAGRLDVDKFIETARRGADRAADLVQRLLTFARRQPLEPRALQPNRLVVSVAALVRRSLPESIAVETVLAPGAWWVSADQSQLESALLNLALNARDAMPSGGRLTVETANAFLDEAYARANADVAPGEYAMIAVSDTGVGMPEDSVARAFEPFFTTKEIGQGSGLGLSQVYGFVKQSRGHVKIYSELNVGTTVKVYLPRLEGPVPEEVPGEVSQPQPIKGGESILVVEDDEDVRRFTVESLDELGYRVLQAKDASSALETVGKGDEIDLLFTDVGLPGGVNGRELAAAARKRKPRLRVLFTSGYARNAVVHGGVLDPGVDFVGKPYTQSALAKRVREALDRERLA